MAVGIPVEQKTADELNIFAKYGIELIVVVVLIFIIIFATIVNVVLGIVVGVIFGIFIEHTFREEFESIGDWFNNLGDIKFFKGER